MKAPSHLLNAIRYEQEAHIRHGNRLNDMWAEFGKAVRAQRRQRKMKLYQFAHALGYTTTMISYLETGRRQWPLAKAQQAVSLLNRGEKWPDV